MSLSNTIGNFLQRTAPALSNEMWLNRAQLMRDPKYVLNPAKRFANVALGQGKTFLNFPGVGQSLLSNAAAIPAMISIFNQGEDDSLITQGVDALSETPFGLKVNEETDIGKRASDFIGNLFRGNQEPSQSTEEALEKYGFNDNFELKPSTDGTLKVVQSGKGLEESAYKDFLERTKNSPAMRAGVFDPRDLFKQSQMNDAFQAAKNAGTLEQFAQQYPNSQTAKQFAIDKRIPTSLDMEF